jgi:glycosyltransferase involved in cell wall biosynthesis
MDGTDAPPRVLFLFTEIYAHGGIQRFNQTLIEACERLETSGVVLSLQDTAAVSAARTIPGRLRFAGFAGDRRRFAIAVSKTLLREHFDRVLIGHINFLTLATTILALCPRRPPRALLIAHGIEVWSGIGRQRRFGLSRMDQILCVSRYTRRRLLEQAPGLSAERLIIFPNALAGQWRNAAPAPPGRPLPERFILSVTRLEPGDRYKGIATVIEAFSMLADRELQYIVVGQGRDLPFLELVAARSGVRDRVQFLDQVSDLELIALYRNCLAFVLPSGKEGFGIVFLEAMFFGAPVIAAAEKGSLDVVRDGKTGVAVAFGDTIAIKEAIERLDCDAGLRKHLRSSGRHLVTDGGPFTFECFAQRVAEVFRADTGSGKS